MDFFIILIVFFVEVFRFIGTLQAGERNRHTKFYIKNTKKYQIFYKMLILQCFHLIFFQQNKFMPLLSWQKVLYLTLAREALRAYDRRRYEYIQDCSFGR